MDDGDGVRQGYFNTIEDSFIQWLEQGCLAHHSTFGRAGAQSQLLAGVIQSDATAV